MPATKSEAAILFLGAALVARRRTPEWMSWWEVIYLLVESLFLVGESGGDGSATILGTEQLWTNWLVLQDQ